MLGGLAHSAQRNPNRPPSMTALVVTAKRSRILVQLVSRIWPSGASNARAGYKLYLGWRPAPGHGGASSWGIVFMSAESPYSATATAVTILCRANQHSPLRQTRRMLDSGNTAMWLIGLVRLGPS